MEKGGRKEGDRKEWGGKRERKGREEEVMRGKGVKGERCSHLSDFLQCYAYASAFKTAAYFTRNVYVYFSTTVHQKYMQRLQKRLCFSARLKQRRIAKNAN